MAWAVEGNFSIGFLRQVLVMPVRKWDPHLEIVHACSRTRRSGAFRTRRTLTERPEMSRVRQTGLLGLLLLGGAVASRADDDTEPLLENATLSENKAIFEGKGVKATSGMETGMSTVRGPTFVDPMKPLDKTRPVESRQRLPPDTTNSEVQKLAKGLGHPLSIFGLSFFRELPSTFAPLDMMAPPADYRIAVGDVLDLKVWGSVTMFKRLPVDGSGQVFIPQIGPVSVAGVKFGNLDEVLKQSLNKQFRDFQIQTSLGRQNSLQIYVTGNARSSGAYTIGGFSTLMNALLACGGPSTNGSVREVELRRGGKLIVKFDLYELLLRGDKSNDFSLQSGDVIHIPPVKSQVAIYSGVVNPAIYEMKSGESLYDLIRWAGGYAIGVDGHLFRRERVVQDSGLRVEMTPLQDSGRNVLVRNGDIIQLPASSPKFENAVTLKGQVRLPGRYPWKPGMKVKDLIPKVSDLVTDNFWAKENGASDSATFAGVEAGRRMDVNWDYAMIERLSLDSLNVSIKSFNLGDAIRGGADGNIPLLPGDAVSVFGAQDLAVPIQSRPLFVRLDGEVRQGGLVRVKFGEKLKDVLRRTGGLTENAYVYGAKLLRKSTKEMQRENYRKVVSEMERQFEGNVATILASATSMEESKLLQNQVDAQRKWFRKLKSESPEGRLVLELKGSEKLSIDDLPDVTLEDGDVFTVPSVPSAVNVFGEVANPSSFLFVRDQSVGNYLKRAGGGTKYCDMDQAFVLRADGSVVGEAEYGFLFWHLTSLSVLPGDVLVVPRKVETTRWLTQVKDWSQIFANFGLSAAAIVTLSKGL